MRARHSIVALLTVTWLAATFTLDRIAVAAELVTLSPENYAEFRPRGKEVDVVWGDYVLRNDKIVAGVADNNQHNGRSGSRRGAAINGRLMDLTTRENGNDLLNFYDPAFTIPNFRAAPIPEGIVSDANKQGDIDIAAEKHKKPGRGPKFGKTVTLTIPYKTGLKEARYILADGWPYLRIEAEYHNATDKLMTVDPFGLFQFGPSAIKDNPHLLYGIGAREDLHWACDPWFGQAYGVIVEGTRIEQVDVAVRPSWLLHHSVVAPATNPAKLTASPATRPQTKSGSPFTPPAPAATIVIPPGQSKVVTRLLIPGKNLFDVQATALEMKGVSLRDIKVTARDADGPIAGAAVTAYLAGRRVYGIGKTNEKGELHVRLPAEPMRLEVMTIDLHQQSRDLAADAGSEQSFIFPVSAWADVNITGESGADLPCKVQFRGIAPTPDPQFFTTMGDERVAHMLQPADGKIRQRLPAGKYRVTITRGIEYDAVQMDIEAVPGKTVPVHAKLRRTVDTTGWISTELANRSTISRNWTIATTRGRVLNLLAEGIEFAPATEELFVSTFKPIIKELGAERWMKTEDGINMVQPVRKSWTAQNTFPIKFVEGDQDGGIAQRPAHMFLVYWLANIPHKLDQNGEIITTGGDRKLIQVTPPNIWPNDGRSDGMASLFDERNVRIEQFMRNARLREIPYYHAMEIQPLDVFLNLPAHSVADPTGQRDLDDWFEQLDERRKNHWPQVSNRNRDWLRMLNLGFRIPGMVNNAARNNLNGTGFWRTYLNVGHDDPAKLTTEQVMDTIQAGRMVMTNGPYLSVTLSADGKTAGPGENLLAKSKSAELQVKVQCPDWMDVDRVQVLFNGHRVEAMEASRAKGSAGFNEKGVLRYATTLPLKFDADAMVIVIASGQGKNLRPQGANDKATFTAIAMSNPIYVDTDGNGFKPHSPVDDKVFTRIDVAHTPRAGQRLPVKLTLKNTAGITAEDEVELRINPVDAAEVVKRTVTYRLEPGEEKVVMFEVTPTGKEPGFGVRVMRSTVGVGRRAAGLGLMLGKPPTKLEAGWLYEHAPDLRAAKGLPAFRGASDEAEKERAEEE